jgi:hypothetical protein
MDAKIIVYGFCLVAIVGGSFFWRYAMEMDDVEKEVVNARVHLNNIEDGVKQAKAWAAARKEAAALIAAAAKIKEGNDALHDEIQAVQKKRIEVAKNYMGTIERARAQTSGMSLPELTLSTGVSLKNVKIQSIDEEIAVLHHSQGVSKVSTNMLPPIFKDRMRYGYNPTGLGSPSGPSTKTADTSASDRLARMGANGPPPEPKPAEPAPSKASVPPPPAAAVSGQRESLGRVYVPGKGWQRAGVGGFVAPPTAGTPTTSGTDN